MLLLYKIILLSIKLFLIFYFRTDFNWLVYYVTQRVHCSEIIFSIVALSSGSQGINKLNNFTDYTKPRHADFVKKKKKCIIITIKPNERVF